MRVASVALLALPLALAACDVRTDDKGSNVHIGIGSGDSGGDNVHIAMNGGDKTGDRVSIDVPGFNANVKLPGLDLGSHMDLDGVKLAPDSSVKGMDLFGSDRAGRDDHGTVHIAFTNPKNAAAMLDYYRAALKDAGFEIGATSADGIDARKNDKNFALKVSPDGSGSRGTITITGG